MRALQGVGAVYSRHATLISVALVVVLALVVQSARFTGRIPWSADSLFYQAQVYELRGDSQTAAMQKAFAGEPKAVVGRDILRWHPGNTSVSNPGWIKFSARFYRRRWLVPAIAAVLYPFAHLRSLTDAAILGYVAIGLLLFALLRQRFSAGLSLAVAAACLLLPPVREYGGYPLTDSWGLAMELTALLAAVIALERGGWSLAGFGAAMLVLSFTRDATIAVVIAVAWVMAVLRTRRAAAVFSVGLCASIPAPVIFGVPLVQQLTWQLDGYRYPAGASWSYVLHHYPSAILNVVHHDLVYPGGLQWPYVMYLGAAVLAAAVGYMLVKSPRRDPFYLLQKGLIAGGVPTVLLAVSYTNMRLELVFMPLVAVALAFTGDRLLALAALTGPYRRWAVTRNTAASSAGAPSRLAT
jgi:hypothetical protein